MRSSVLTACFGLALLTGCSPLEQANAEPKPISAKAQEAFQHVAAARAASSAGDLSAPFFKAQWDDVTFLGD